ncbi:unnamed protein product [Arctogadus glacialis]
MPEEDVSVGDVRQAGCGVLDSPSSPAAGGADWDYVCLCAAPLRTPTRHVHRVHHLSKLPPVFGPDPAKNIFKIKSSKLPASRDKLFRASQDPRRSHSRVRARVLKHASGGDKVLALSPSLAMNGGDARPSNPTDPDPQFIVSEQTMNQTSHM